VRDTQVEEFRQRGRAATHADAVKIASALKQAGILRNGLTTRRAADIIYAIAASESLYLRFVDHGGWKPRDYARVLEQVLKAALSG
jgi:hypothetical protein